MLRRLKVWLGLIAPPNRPREIDEELQAHIDARVDDLVAKGRTRDQAREEALARFGDFTASRAALHAQASGRPGYLTIADRAADLADDAKYIVRTLSRQPAFTLGVALTMALGIGVNAAVFRIADFVLFRAPAGVTQPADLRWVEQSVTVGRGTPMRSSGYAYPDAALMLTARNLDGISAYANVTLRDADGRDVTSAYADGAFFSTLGVRAAVGRLFDTAEGAPGANVAVSVISDRYWRERFGAAPLDTLPMLTVGPHPSRVIGVLPKGFGGLEPDPVDVWIPFGIAEIGRSEINGVPIPWYRSTMIRSLRVVARIPRGGEPAAVAALSAAITLPDDAADHVVRRAELKPVVPMGGLLRNQESNVLLRRLSFVAVLILVIATANAVNLMLARGVRRRQEIAIRLAIGASRWRISRLVAGESLALALGGGVLAALAGMWTAESLRRLLFPDAKWNAGALDVRTLLFTLSLALVAGGAAAIFPAMQATAPDLLSGLRKGGGRAGGSSRVVRTVFAVLQTALSLALVIATGLLVRSMVRLSEVPLGFEPGGLVTVSTGASMFSRIGATGLSADDVRERIPASVVAPENVALTSVVPFGASAVSDLKVIGSDFVPEPRHQPNLAAVDEHYFSVLRTRVISGRGLTAEDTAGSEPVTVISASMAAKYFNNQVPPNACVMPSGMPCARIVGVVEDMRDAPGGAAPPMRYFMPLSQAGYRANGVILRTDANRAGALASFVRSLFPSTQRGVTVEVTADRVNLALRPWRTATSLFAALGALALVISCAGVYSVMNYMAQERAQEIGIRMVLGATPSAVWRMVLVEGLRLAAIGAVAGALAAALAGRYLSALLFQVSPFDPLIYAAGVAALMASCVVAVLAPARRATAVDPLAAIRTE